MNIIKFEPKQDDAQEKRKEQLLEVVDAIRELVESGEVQELAAISMDGAGNMKLHVSCMDLVGAIGMFELGKAALIAEEL